MESIATIFTYGLSFLAVVIVITFVHELGHYLVARWCGVRIEAFSVGFGREIAGWTSRSGTRFKLCLLPLGGYVKMFGEEDMARDGADLRPLTRSERDQSFFHRSIGQRAAIVVAGPFINILFGTLAIAMMFSIQGVVVNSLVIGTVVADSPAESAGLRPGDLILTINGAPVTQYDEVTAAIKSNPGRGLTFGIDRDGRILSVAVVAEAIVKDGKTIGRVGILAERDRHHLDPVTALTRSYYVTADFLAANMRGLADIATGRAGLEDLAGPVRIAELSGKTMVDRGPGALILLAALLSINIGVVNLLPIPVLDGGHLVFMGIELVRRRPLPARVLKVCSLGGFVFLLAVFAIIMSHDILRYTLSG
ncbi:MAG: RIP metalloprotease RseP [Dongiaceae bacterium]